jgi:hypothetical protein
MKPLAMPAARSLLDPLRPLRPSPDPILAARAHRIAQPEDHEPPAEQPRPSITPFVAGDAKGDLTCPRGEIPMPRGQYQRKPRAPKDATTDKPVEGASRAPRKTRAIKAKPGRRRKDGEPIGAASFVIDDRGGMEIRDGQQSVRLERADVGRLTQFLERTKGIRA